MDTGAGSYNSRHMFERYLYDYLVKRNMHQTAEILRNEANLRFDPNGPPTIDVPEGFLMEWWSLNYNNEFLRQWLHMNEIQGSDALRAWNAFQEKQQYPMNVEAMNELPKNFTPTFNIVSNSVPSFEEDIGEVPLLYFPSSHIEVYGGLSQLLLPPQHGESFQPLLPPLQGEGMPKSVNVANAIGQEKKRFVHDTFQDENTALDEEMDPFIDNLLKSFWKFEPDYMELFENSTVEETGGSISIIHEMNDLTVSLFKDSTNMNEFADHISPSSNGDDSQSQTIHQLESNEEEIDHYFQE